MVHKCGPAKLAGVDSSPPPLSRRVQHNSQAALLKPAGLLTSKQAPPTPKLLLKPSGPLLLLAPLQLLASFLAIFPYPLIAAASLFTSKPASLKAPQSYCCHDSLLSSKSALLPKTAELELLWLMTSSLVHLPPPPPRSLSYCCHSCWPLHCPAFPAEIVRLLSPNSVAAGPTVASGLLAASLPLSEYHCIAYCSVAP